MPTAGQCFSLSDENDVHVIGHCCPVCPLQIKLKFVTTDYHREVGWTTSDTFYMSDNYFNLALFYFQALFTTWSAYISF
jgi:hypothetical protein